MSKNIFVIGGKTQARSLAESLILKKYHVTMINDDIAVCNRAAEIKGLEVICGDGSKVTVLEDADIQNCDVAIAMHDHDADNLVVCQLCKEIYHVKKVVALVSDARRIAFFYKIGVDSVVSASTAITSLIEQSSVTSDLAHVIPIAEGRIRIMEVNLPDNSKLVDKTLADISLPQGSIIGCIIRGVENIIPRGNTKLQKNDTLMVLCSPESEAEAIRIITGR